MNNIAKKIMIYSLAGIMQAGLGATIIEASPLHSDGPQRIVQLDDRHDEHDRRQREENRRHEREMHRHDRESDRDWHDRRDRENNRHNNTMNEIAAGIIGIGIGSLIG